MQKKIGAIGRALRVVYHERDIAVLLRGREDGERRLSA